MSYTDLTFWLSLAGIVAGVALLPVPARRAWLILASLWFYAAPEAMRLVWLAGVCAITLAAAGPSRAIPGLTRKMAGIAVLALGLVWARFFELLGLPDPKAPPGLSFIVFTAIAVIVERGNGVGQGTGSWRWSEIVLHLMWFPKLLAGPIERAGTLIPQFSGIALRPGLARLGLAYLVTGLVKKVVIADTLASIVSAGFAHPSLATPVDLVLAVYAFAFQIYCDFSGYSDIAIGLSAFAGLRLSRNFDRPYLSVTVTEFWSRRWHITLGTWFRDFVYIPLGGNRRGWPRQVMNLMVVFVLSGLWHAGLGYGVSWGFLLWGTMNGLFVAIETRLPVPAHSVARILRGIVTFHLVLLTWVFFRADSVETAMTLLRRVLQSLGDLPALLVAYPYTADHRLCAALIGTLFLAEAFAGRSGVAARLAGLPLPLRWTGLYAAIALLLLAGRWQGEEFIYAGF